jgi:hypothetical protein
MSKTETNKDFYDAVEAAYKMKECLSYIEAGSFKKDLTRTLAVLSSEKIDYKFNNQKTNAKLGTLIGKSLFFDTLSEESIIKQCEFLKSIYLGKENLSDEQVIFKFDSFNVLKNGNHVLIKLKETPTLRSVQAKNNKQNTKRKINDELMDLMSKNK